MPYKFIETKALIDFRHRRFRCSFRNSIWLYDEFSSNEMLHLLYEWIRITHLNPWRIFIFFRFTWSKRFGTIERKIKISFRLHVTEMNK